MYTWRVLLMEKREVKKNARNFYKLLSLCRKVFYYTEGSTVSKDFLFGIPCRSLKCVSVQKSEGIHLQKRLQRSSEEGSAKSY